MRFTTTILPALTASLTTGAHNDNNAKFPRSAVSIIEFGIHAPTYRVAGPWPRIGSGQAHSHLDIKCRTIGPQCIDVLPAGALANETLSVRVYCKVTRFFALEARPIFMDPCPPGSRCTLAHTSTERPPSKAAELALWTQDEDGYLPGLEFEKDLAAWVNLEGLLQRVDGAGVKEEDEGDDGKSRTVPASNLIIPPEDRTKRRPSPYQFRCVIGNDHTREGGSQ
ncbi:hypothetical protein F5Y01DRAFT_327954 [Xylaria sp. FL0043]|nr:hypothetical protein F5Y01DRAFT_327954 [Xylaria sp. FL0043]